jgi:hypothetical protein
VGALLLLDVDGPLNPWAAPPDDRPEGYVEHRFRLSRWRRRAALRVWLNPRHGTELTALAERTGVELAWATTWGHEANRLFGPVLGLPPLPVIEFAGPQSDTLPTWKYPAVARFARGRPLAWLDDDFALYASARDAFLARRHASGMPTLLVPVDPHVGLTGSELASVETWLSSLQDVSP